MHIKTCAIGAKLKLLHCIRQTSNWCVFEYLKNRTCCAYFHILHLYQKKIQNSKKLLDSKILTQYYSTISIDYEMNISS